MAGQEHTILQPPPWQERTVLAQRSVWYRREIQRIRLRTGVCRRRLRALGTCTCRRRRANTALPAAHPVAFRVSATRHGATGQKASARKRLTKRSTVGVQNHVGRIDGKIKIPIVEGDRVEAADLNLRIGEFTVDLVDVNRDMPLAAKLKSSWKLTLRDY